MATMNLISEAVIEATKAELSKYPGGQKFFDIKEGISTKETELAKLKAELLIAKVSLPVIPIKWRESVRWCIEIDSKNPSYFLKSSQSVYNCVAFKHNIEAITPDIKNKIATTLSMLFNEGKEIGRLTLNGIHYYGMKEFFKDNLIELKDEYKKNLDRLIL
jgi:hypothetical protein